VSIPSRDIPYIFVSIEFFENRSSGKTVTQESQGTETSLLAEPGCQSSPKFPGAWPVLILLAKSKTHAIQGQHALVHAVCQSASPRENDFAGRINDHVDPDSRHTGPGKLDRPRTIGSSIDPDAYGSLDMWSAG
jgi:hypothetical protein